MSKFKTLEEVKFMYDCILSNTHPGGQLYPKCVEYGAGDCYTRMDKIVPPRQVRISMRAHRIALLWKLQLLNVPDSCETSHLCGNKACVKLDHLNAEPHFVNCQRTECHLDRVCSQTHPTGYPKCVL